MNRSDQKRIREKLAKDNVCYVLITCGEPKADGNMDVEMIYEGDAALASYLLQGAQSYIDAQEEEEEEEKQSCTQSKIISLGG